MTLCLVWHESRKVGWCSRNKALSSLSSQCLYMFLYLSSGRSGDHRGLRLWPGFPIFHHVLMVAVHFRNPLRGCAGFRPFDCRNRYARGVGGLRCRPGHHIPPPPPPPLMRRVLRENFGLQFFRYPISSGLLSIRCPRLVLWTLLL